MGVTAQRVDGRPPVGAPELRRGNLVRVLGALRASGPASRATVAAATGLTKATVSAVVVDLAARGLLVEGEIRRSGTAGRPGRLLDPAAAPVRAVGVEVNTDHVTGVLLDLAGGVRHRERVAAGNANATAATVLGRVADVVSGALEAAAEQGARVAGLTVSVPGLVDADRVTVLSTPNLPLSGVDVAARLAALLPGTLAGVGSGAAVGTRAGVGVGVGVGVTVANDADLAATAEYRRDPAAPGDLVYLTGEVGVGAGIVVGGRVLRGSGGFAGEVGHLPVPGSTRRCGCGRVGCLETEAGLGALLRAGAAGGGLPAADVPALLLAAGDPAVRAALAQVGRALGYGVAVLVDVLDPARVVLGGAFAALAGHLLPAAAAEVTRRSVLPGAAARLAASATGPDAAALGAAITVLDGVFDDPAAVQLSAGAPATRPADPARPTDARTPAHTGGTPR